MRTPSIDQLALLSEEEAVQREFDTQNWRTLRWLFLGAAIYAFVMLVSFARAGYPAHRMPLAWLHAGWLLAIFILRNRTWFERRFRAVFLCFIAAEYVFTILIFFGLKPVDLATITFPLILMVSRLRAREFVYLMALFTGVSGVCGMILREDLAQVVERSVLGPLAAIAFFAGIGAILARIHRTRFVQEWRSVASREHERLRMQDELELARQIQTSMEPDAPPSVAWLDIAAYSMPATEVGGDFYDFYQLDDDRVALVVGDVAGHGVASGLVLAALKGGLFLLRDRLHDPIAAATLLDAMVRDAIRWRMLVSMLIAIVDRKKETVTVLAAGHPPLLLRSARDGEVRAIGSGSLPLGTTLRPIYTVMTAPAGAGDVIVMATDGVIETISPEGEPFGEERLVAALTRSQGDGADRTRIALETELRAFRGSARQQDDVTFLVVAIQ